MSVSQIKLTEDGPVFSRFVYGMWRLAAWEMNPAELARHIEECLKLGLTTFDHADIYGDYTCEALFGQVLAHNSSLRERMQLVTKCGIKLISPNRPEHTLKHYDTSRDHIIASVETSLRNLHTDYVDLLLIHRPDPLMDVDEIAGAFAELHQAGKVLHFGVSNFTPFQFTLLDSRLDLPLVTNQIEVSVMHTQPLHDGTLDQCQRLRLAPMAWSPLGGGRIFKADTGQAVRVRAALEEIGQQLGGADIDQIAFAWLLRHPARIIPILGTRSMARLKSALAAESIELSREQWFAIWQASAGHEVP